jgi:hypothetical protein
MKRSISNLVSLVGLDFTSENKAETTSHERVGTLHKDLEDRWNRGASGMPYYGCYDNAKS